MTRALSLVALSLLSVALTQPEVADGAGGCKGKTASVFLIQSVLNRGDSFSLPDTYIKMTVGQVTMTSKVIHNQKSAVFEEWFVFKNAQNDTLKIEIWDKDSGFNDDDFMGKCLIQLQKPITSEKKCSFENGEVSVGYTCM